MPQFGEIAGHAVCRLVRQADEGAAAIGVVIERAKQQEAAAVATASANATQAARKEFDVVLAARSHEEKQRADADMAEALELDNALTAAVVDKEQAVASLRAEARSDVHAALAKAAEDKESAVHVAVERAKIEEAKAVAALVASSAAPSVSTTSSK